jgi:predicted enzyme related to lactoylglutathione lyase
MGERTEHPPGTFSWTDLYTPDREGAKTFYGGLFGWEAEDSPLPGGGVYTMLRKDGHEVAALAAAPQAEFPPFWGSYVTVSSADDAAARAKELGGTVLAEPFDVMQAGRMAILQDPQGAFFSVWEPREHVGAQLVNVDGALTFNQLNASDRDAARAFYEGLFGWRFEEISSQPLYWSIHNGDRSNGGVMDLPPGSPAPSHWLVYFAVDDLDGAAARIRELGGEVVVPPTAVPAGRFVVARDPQGAYFALFAGELDD